MILILEDDLIMQKLYARIFKGRYNVSIVGTVKEAVVMLKETWPNVFISDMRLPDGSGAEAVRYCKNRYPTLPIIVVSGTLDDSNGLEVFAKFEKPFNPDALMQKVAEAL